MEDNINNLDMIFEAGGDPGACSAPVRNLVTAIERQPELAEQSEAETTAAAASWKESNPTELPREKAMKYGIESLETVELMAILLHTGIKGKSVLELSADILRESDNRLSHLSRLSIHELMNDFRLRKSCSFPFSPVASSWLTASWSLRSQSGLSLGILDL